MSKADTRKVYIVTVSGMPGNVAGMRVRVRANSPEEAEARVKKHVEGTDNHLVRLARGKHPPVRLRDLRYTAAEE